MKKTLHNSVDEEEDKSRRLCPASTQQSANLADGMPRLDSQDSPPPVARKGSLSAAIEARLALLPRGDEKLARHGNQKTVGIYHRRANEVKRPYWVVTWDKACSLPCERIIEANSPEQAGAKAVKTANAENGYGPNEDGGFVPVGAYDRTELLAMLVDLDKHDSRRDC